jgi:GTP diphosphokinase / guanosine-3',5'-bis(diphosphate) 3'-diphosphatase
MSSLQAILSNLASTQKEDRALIEKAYAFAEDAHKDHKRYSGEPYFSHLSATAFMLAEMGMGPKTVAAALLHDSIEDTGVKPEVIRDEFGPEILFLVEGVTKLGSVRYHGTDRHNESLRKLFVATSEDIRVLIIKLVDRLHNMQTLHFVPKEKQLRIARETLEIYVPVAHRLGMGRLRKELEDLAFPYVYPNEYKKVIDLVAPDMKDGIVRLEKLRKTLQKHLAAEVKGFKTHHRIKGMYSLFRKLERRDWDMDKIYDLFAIRILVPSIDVCYQTLGIVHQMWRPLPQRVKDYIAFPKPNGYQSLHTTVITPDGAILEVQIRTEAMHRESEFGVASHLAYKQAQSGQITSRMADLIPTLFRPFRWNRGARQDVAVTTSKEYNIEQVPQWIREIADAHKGSEDTGEFVTGLREDFFSHRIFAFTPKGDVIDLPIGASAIDFAYAIHTDIGNHMSGAKINNKLVQIHTPLENGDIVEIITKQNAKPTLKWLDFVRTTLAQRHIRSRVHELKVKNS